MSKIGHDSCSHDYDSGAFKSVEIFEHFVRKSALDSEGERTKLSESEARYNSSFYDENNEFHYSWVGYHYGESVDNDCYTELEVEFEYVNKKKHLPIIVPIVEGDKECYVMPRAKLFNEFNPYSIADKVLKRRSKEIKISLIGRIQQVGGRATLQDLSYRVDNLIRLGIAAKLSNEKIISNLFWFVAEDASCSLLADMHNANIGIYRRNIVTFDTGQLSYETKETTIRNTYKRDLYFLKKRLERKLREQKR
jgi:hypothetical protein